MNIAFGFIFVVVLAALCVIQLFYFLYFFIRLLFFKHKEEDLSNEYFSIIICARNEENNLRANLQFWLAQQYHDNNGVPKYEVIIVDDNSEDGSSYLYQEFVPLYTHLRILTLRQEAKGIKGKKFPLSMGIKEAKYNKLLLTDADCKPSSEFWLQKMANQYSTTKQIVLGYAPYTKLDGFLNKWIRWETLHTAIQYLSYALAKNTYMGVGRNLSYAKAYFLENKGFSEHNHIISGDDDLFINKVANSNNTTICIAPETFMESKPKTTYENWWLQKQRHMSTGKLYKGKHKFLLGLYNFSHFAFWCIFIVCLFFPQYYLITLPVFLLRWIVQTTIFGLCAKRLQEKDLISIIWLFDILTLFYNLRLLPSVFKTKNKWN